MSAPKSKAPLRLNVQHDYVSLVHANWRYTVSFGGEKGSGILAKDAKAFQALSDYVKQQRAAGRNVGDIMKSLADTAVITRLWPEWNVAPVLPELKAEGYARVIPGSLFLKKFPGTYRVASLTKRYAFLVLPTGRQMGLPVVELEVAPPPVAQP